MFRLIKSELLYNKLYLAVIFLFPLFFAAGMYYGVSLISGSQFFEKYSWSIIVGLGSYIFIFMIWQIRYREKRTIMFTLLPLSIKQIAWARMIFGITPFMLILLIIIAASLMIGKNSEVFVYRISAQLGLLFMFLSFLQLVIDLWFLSTKRHYYKNFLIAGSVGCITIFISIYAVFDLLIPLYRMIFKQGEEYMFFLWGIILLVCSNLIYQKRKTFLT